MTMIILVNDIDQNHLAEVRAEMAVLGTPTIRAYDAGDHLIAIEGSHRLRAAEELGIPVNIVTINEDETIDLNTLDWDDMGWFDERVVTLNEFIAQFTAHPWPMRQETAQIEVVMV